ncbi:MAG: sigma-70 family RNA polymerase sigma factor [Christensenellales bacterium]|jgi:RNA polymerase sigma-B factor
MGQQGTALSEQALLERYAKTRSETLRNQILEKYLYIAEIVAKKFVGRGVEYDDLFQVASLALVKALDRFEPSRGVKFASFATPTLVGEIKNYFRDKTRMVRISRRESEMVRKLEEAKAHLTAKYSRSATPEQVAEYMGLSVERVLELMEARSAGYATSLDSYVAAGEDSQLIKLVGSTDDAYEQIEDKDFLKYCFEHLNDVEKKVIEQRYGQNKSQREVAAMLGVSQMYISRIERRILLKFRNFYEK